MPVWAVILIILGPFFLLFICSCCCTAWKKRNRTPRQRPSLRLHSVGSHTNESLPVGSHTNESLPAYTVDHENDSIPPTLPPPVYVNVLPDTSPNHHYSTNNATRKQFEAGLRFSQDFPPSISPPSLEELNFLGYYKHLALSHWLISPLLDDYVSTTSSKTSHTQASIRFHPQGNDLSIQTQLPLPASITDALLRDTICQDSEHPLESITSISYFEVTILAKP
ncbi:hypothetical protein K493DRAFT_317301, partial [Basidiobolus meristosporus CBS 931.73]